MVLPRFRCAGCGYGASRRAEPERCPMCGGCSWDPDEWPTTGRLGEEAWAEHGLGRDLLS